MLEAGPDVRSDLYPRTFLCSSMNANHVSRRLFGLVLLSLIFFVPSLARAQGVYLPQGVEGAGASAAFSGSKVGKGPALSLGYAGKGRLGFGLTFAYIAYSGEAAGRSAEVLAPHVSYFGARQASGDAVNAEVLFSYEYATADGSSLSSLSVGLAVSRNVTDVPGYYVLPQASALFTPIYFGGTWGAYTEGPNTDPTLTFGAGLGFGFPLGESNVIAFEPGVAFNKSGLAGAFSLGVVFRTPQ